MTRRNTQKKRGNVLHSGFIAAALLGSLALCFFPSASYAAGGFPFIGVLYAGQHPEAVAVDTQTHIVYIAYEGPGLVVGFDPSSGHVRWKTPFADTVSDVQVDSTTHRVYAASSSFRNRTSVLSVLDGATGKVLLTAPIGNGDNGIAIDTKRQRVYVSSSDSGVVNAFTLRTSPTGQLSTRSSTLSIGPHPQAIGVNSRLGRLYVGDIANNTVSVYDEDAGRILAIIQVAALPVQPLRVDETNGRVYVVCSNGEELDVIDGNSNEVIATVPTGPYPEGVAYNTATGRIYVANEGQKDNSFTDNSVNTTITVIDGQSFDVLGTLKVGRSPDGVEADPQLRRVYVALEDSDAVVEVSDSVDLPLLAPANLHQAAAVHTAISALQVAFDGTIALMLLTIVAATLVALSQRWRARESPRTLPGDV
ncbi:MAG: YncE family protein [Ktedonobacteraceae bacterium]